MLANSVTHSAPNREPFSDFPVWRGSARVRNAVAEVISDARGLSNRHLAKLPDGGLVELNPPGQVRDLPPRENRSGFRRGSGAPAPALQDRYPPDPRDALRALPRYETPACAPCGPPRRVGDRKPDRKG